MPPEVLNLFPKVTVAAFRELLKACSPLNPAAMSGLKAAASCTCMPEPCEIAERKNLAHQRSTKEPFAASAKLSTSRVTETGGVET